VNDYRVDYVPQVPKGFWWCGRCKSLIPLTYWHRCTDESSSTGPRDKELEKRMLERPR